MKKARKISSAVGKPKEKRKRGTDATNEVASAQWFSVVGAILLIFIVWVVFRSAVSHTYVNWDDPEYVEEQPLVLEKKYKEIWTTPVSLNYHPITMLSLAIQSPGGGQLPTAERFIRWNIYIHLVNTLLVFLMTLGLWRGCVIPAFAVACIFGIHPMHIESVIWISERKDVLYSLFFFGGLLSYWQYGTGKGNRWLWFAWILMVLSVLSKAMAVVFPVVLLLLDDRLGRGWRQLKVWKEKIPFFVVSILFGLIALDVQSGGNFGGLFKPGVEQVVAVADMNVFSIWERLCFASYGFFFYVFKFFVPNGLSPFYPYPDQLNWSFQVAPVLFGLTMSAVWLLRNRFKDLFTGIYFYFITIALVLQFITVGLAITADRYSYLSYIGLGWAFLGTGWVFLRKRGASGQWFFLILIIPFIGYLISRTIVEIEKWRNSETLWTAALEVYPNSDLALANRGNYLGKMGRIEEAKRDFELALSLGSNRWDVYEGLGNVYGTLSMDPSLSSEERISLLEKSKEMYLNALKYNPGKGNVLYNMGVTSFSLDPVSCIEPLSQALPLLPQRSKEIVQMLAEAYFIKGDYERALEKYHIAIDQYGLRTEYNLMSRAQLFIQIGNVVSAKRDLLEVLQINPENAQAKSMLNALH